MNKRNEVPVEKNQTLVVEIEDLTYEGLGVAKVEGYPLFVENALPGEKIDMLVLKTGKQFGYGKVQTLLEKSDDRVLETDDMLLRTGIAPLQHLKYDKQLAFKEEQVRRAVERGAKLSGVEILPTIGMAHPEAYRNKAQIPVRKVAEALTTGFFRKNSHDLIPMENFYIQDPKIDDAVKIVRDIMRSYQVKPYNERDNTGNLRHIIVRRGHYSHEMMIVLVTRTGKLFQYEKMVEDITAALPEVVSIIQNINPESTNVILGKESRLLFGENYVTDTLLGKKYHISSHSFYQVNTVQAEILYQKALEFAALKPTDIVIDAYSGIGTISLALADQVKQVYGVEVIKEAVQDAKLNALVNEVENVTFEKGTAEVVMKKWQAADIRANVLVVDPPRKGLAPEFIAAALEMKPERFVYISCNPATFARDVKLLVAGGYQLQKVQPVDMFPQTAHIETVALLTRK